MLNGAKDERPLPRQMRHRAVVHTQQPAQFSSHDVTARGDLAAAPLALEQRAADARLEPAHVLGDRRLRQVQRLGRPVVAAVVDDGEERADVAKIEVHVVNDNKS